MNRENIALAIVVGITTIGMIAGYILQATGSPKEGVPQDETVVESAETAYMNKHLKDFEALGERDLGEVDLTDLRATDETPDGVVVMQANGATGSFIYWADSKNIKFGYLDSVARFFCVLHDCKDQYAAEKIDLVEAIEEEREKTKAPPAATIPGSIFAAFKHYNVKHKKTASSRPSVRNQFKYGGTLEERQEATNVVEEQPKVGYQEWAEREADNNNS